jgi:hypothetical protein
MFLPAAEGNVDSFDYECFVCLAFNWLTNRTFQLWGILVNLRDCCALATAGSISSDDIVWSNVWITSCVFVTSSITAFCDESPPPLITVYYQCWQQNKMLLQHHNIMHMVVCITY